MAAAAESEAAVLDAEAEAAAAAARAAAQLPRGGESPPPRCEDRPLRARNDATGSPLKGRDGTTGGIISTSSKLKSSSSSPLATNLLRERVDLLGTVAGLGLRGRLAFVLASCAPARRPPKFDVPSCASCGARALVRPEDRVVPEAAALVAVGTVSARFEEPDEYNKLDAEPPEVEAEAELERSECGSETDDDEDLQMDESWQAAAVEDVVLELVVLVLVSVSVLVAVRFERAPPLRERDLSDVAAAASGSGAFFDSLLADAAA